MRAAVDVVPLPAPGRPGSPAGAPRAGAGRGCAGAVGLPDGERVRVREVGPRDRAAVLDLHARCSEQTLRLRYRGPAADAGRYAAHLLEPRHGRSFAVEAAGGALIALGHLLGDGEDSEIALLVADPWQRRGVGTLLLRRLVEAARELRRPSVYGMTGPCGAGLRTAERAVGVPVAARREADGVVVLSAVVEGIAANSPYAGEDGGPAVGK